MLRLFFLVVFLAGGAAGIAYPWAASNLTGYQIGSWEVYRRDTGFVPAGANLAPSDAPITLTVDVVTAGPLRGRDKPAFLTLVASADGNTELTQVIDLSGIDQTIVSPQSPENVYRRRLGTLDAVKSARYMFTFGEGEAPLDQLQSVTLTLNAGAFDLDPRAVPAGYILMVIGAVGLLLSFRKASPSNPNSQPPAPRWGRGRKDD